jgi:hypothetical protein
MFAMTRHFGPNLSKECTIASISERLTLKLVTLVLVLEGS